MIRKYSGIVAIALLAGLFADQVLAQGQFQAGQGQFQTAVAMPQAGMNQARMPQMTMPQGAMPVAAQQPSFTFIVFWRENDQATQEVHAKLQAAMGKRAQLAGWASINITDPAQQETVNRFQVSRAPMPLVLCVAKSGAITGAITEQITDEAIDQAIVTPTMARVTKEMQDGKLVLLYITAEDKARLLQGAGQFVSDPAFASRTAVVGLRRADPNEARLLAEMKIDPNMPGSFISLLVPPGISVGMFPEDVSKEQLAAALHAAGKCCDDPSCTHAQKGQ